MTNLQTMQSQLETLAEKASQADIARHPFAQTLLNRYAALKAEIDAATQGMGYLERLLALWSEESLRARGWDVAAMKAAA